MKESGHNVKTLRPSLVAKDEFLFSPKAWLGNAKLRAATPSQRSAWIDCICLMADADKFGVLRWDLDRIARAAGCPVETLQALVDQGILKGAPKGMTCEPYIHTDRRGKEHRLIPSSAGPIWYSSRLVRAAYLREVAAKSGRKGGGNPRLQTDEGAAPKNGDDTLIGDSPGVRSTYIGATQHPPPPDGFPLQPSSFPPTPDEIPTESPDARGDSAGFLFPPPAEPPPRGREKKPVVFGRGVWERACDGWATAYRHVHGSPFHWGRDGRQAKGLRDVLEALGGDLSRFERVAKAWLREPETGKARGHPLHQLAEDLNYIESKIAKGTVGHDPAGNGRHRRRSAAERNEYPEAAHNIKVFDPAAVAG